MLTLTYTACLLFSALGLANAASITATVATEPNLTSFAAILKDNPALVDLIDTSAAKGATVFAPSNKALTASNVLSMPKADQQQVLRYHILNGTYEASSFGSKGGVLATTFLEGDQHALLGGTPNVVFASKFGDAGVGPEAQQASVFTGVGKSALVSSTDMKFATAGVVHVVEGVFALPEPCSVTSHIVPGLTGLVKALNRTELWEFLDETPRITCFAPNDAAFNAAGNPETTLSEDDLALALKYHTLQGDIVAYTSTWGDGDAKEFMTLANETVVVRRDLKNGVLWVNDVKVAKANVLTSNGVQHVLEGVLSPKRKNPPGTNGTTTDNGNKTNTTPTPKPSQTGVKGAGLSLGTNGAMLGVAVLVACLMA